MMCSKLYWLTIALQCSSISALNFPVSPAKQLTDAVSIYGPIKDPLPCNITLDEPSKRRLWYVIYDKTADFIHLNTSMKNDSELSESNSNLVKPRSWIWTNFVGSPLLHYDYRFDSIAVIGSISASIQHININITYEEHCFDSCTRIEKMNLIILAVRSAVYSPKESVHLNQGRQYVCHQIITPYNDMQELTSDAKMEEIVSSSNTDGQLMQLVYHCRQIARETVFEWEIFRPKVPNQALLCMAIGYILFLYSPLLVYFLIPNASAKRRSHDRRRWVCVENADVQQDDYNLTKWVTLDGKTPVDFNIVYVVLLSKTKHITLIMFRRFLFVLGSLWYMVYLAVLNGIYVQEFFKRSQKNYTDVNLWYTEKIFSQNWDKSTVIYFICFLLYIVGGLVYMVGAQCTELIWRYEDDGAFLGEPLEGIRPPNFGGTESDAEVMFTSLVHRATLPVRPVFLKTWTKDILFDLNFLRCLNKRPKYVSMILGILLYPFWFSFVIVFTFVTLNPLGIFLLSKFLQIFPSFRLIQEQDLLSGLKEIGLFILWSVIYLLAFFIFLVVVVVPSVSLLSIMIAYSLTGLLLNYNVVLPRFVLISLAIVRVFSMIRATKEPYLAVKNTLWERAAILLQTNVNKGSHVLAQDDLNQPRVPEPLLQRCYNHLAPSTELSRAKAVASATLIICFVVFVLLTLQSFHLYDDNNLSQLLVSAFLMWAPRLLSSVEQASETKRKQVLLEQRIDYMIDQYVNEQNQVGLIAPIVI